MIVCPVCEHPQAQGAECEVCGKRLVAGLTATELAVPRLDGLEPTRAAPVDAPPERIADLEPTRQDAPAAPAVDPTPDLEATRAAPVDVDAVPVPDLERTGAVIPGDAPTALPAIVTCRYCRTPALPGERICARCGMRLPIVTQGTGAGGAPAAERICSCGAPVRPGAALCPSCGARFA